MMQLIVNWLNSKQNFIVGRILYNQYGKDPELKALFAKGEKEPGAKPALLQALQALLTPNAPREEEEIQNTLILSAAATDQLPGKAAQPVSENPVFPQDPILKALQLEWKSKYKQMQYLRMQLEQYGRDNTLEVQAQCRQLCTQILALEQEIMSIWKKVDEYRATGKLSDIKEAKLEVPEDPVDLAIKISSVQRYIRRHKLNCTKFPENAKYPALVAKYEQQLKELTQQHPKQNQDEPAAKKPL